MNRNEFFIVGIGASAGGMEPLKTFFNTIPKDVNAAFVIIQHLSRDFKSLTADWLSQCTELPIETVNDRTEILPGHIYLHPEHKILKVSGKTLIAEKRHIDEVTNLSIDAFLHTLGREANEKAIGIILSGTGTDGSRGIKTIKSYGGVVLVQDPASATFDSMPSIAISADDPDLILPPKALAEHLIRYVNHRASLSEVRSESWEEDDKVIQDIITHVSEYSSVNFKGYKINTILRRIEKRIKLNRLHSLSEYYHFTKNNRNEIHILYKDLLIGVTYFFRDKEAFRVLETKVIPELFKKKTYETVRIWVAGCCTGEEAYAMAILCEEYREKNSSAVPYKIFATDLDNKSIEFASIGRYNEDIAKDLSQERLEKFFNKQGDFYEIKRSIRKKIIFAQHNLIVDPAFIKLDLLSCRNLFIYLKAEIQKKLLKNFSFALHQNGYLFLGANETSDGVDSIYAAVDSKWKIYKNQAGRHSVVPEFGGAGYIGQKPAIADTAEESFERRSTNGSAKLDAFEEMLLEEFVPACIFLNAKNEVVYTHGELGKYLKIPNKRMNYSIFNMLNESLYILFKNAIRKIKNDALIVHYKDVPIRSEGRKININLSFKSLPSTRDKTRYILIEFIERAEQAYAKVDADESLDNNDALKMLDDMELELKLTKKELQFTVDELETLNEELQASNEEMHSSNEELQSTNEEIQSSNEELHTVNSELQLKFEEIKGLHNDINNLIINTQFTILFLDKELKIRRFTPAAQASFNIMETDIGRPIGHLTHAFKYPDMLSDTELVLKEHHTIEKEVEDVHGEYFKLRILPYFTEDEKVDGVVMTCVNVTNLKQALIDLEQRSKELEISEESWKSLVNHTPDLISRYETSLKIVSINQAYLDFHNVKTEDVIGKTNEELKKPVEPSTRAAWIESLKATFETGEIMHAFYNFYQGKNEKHFYSSFVPEFKDNSTEVSHVMSICRDMTSIKKHELLIQDQVQELKRVNTDLDNFIYTASHDLKAPIANIEGLNRLLRNKLMNKLDDAEIEVVNLIDDSVRRFNKTIKELTEITKVQKNTDNNVESIVLEEIVTDVKLDLGSAISEANASITEDLQVKEIKFARHYLRSIIYNLLSNAIKYSAEGRQPVIQLKTYAEGDYDVISVTDNGMGLTRAEQAKVFGMFKRLHAHVEGSGIGLYTLKRMLENNKGKITLESTKDKGSTFKAYIPRNTAD